MKVLRSALNRNGKSIKELGSSPGIIEGPLIELSLFHCHIGVFSSAENAQDRIIKDIYSLKFAIS